MALQGFILRKKKAITLISGILIILAFISRFAFDNLTFFNLFLMIASVIAIAPIAIQSYQALKVKVVSIDLLVTIAVAAAFMIQNFEESAIVSFLFLFGAWLEARTLNQTRSAIKELTEMAPEFAEKRNEAGDFVQLAVDELDKNDILRVKTGAKVPVDGEVILGEGYINEASITGESVPVNKKEGAKVFAGTILENGTLQIRADRVGEDTTFGQIIELVEEAQDSKSEAERFIDRFSKWYTPTVLLLAIVVWIFTQDIELAITVLVLGCPGALVIGVPVSNVSAIGNGARNGVLLKGSEVINDFSKVDTMIFDKTGSLTVGNPEVAERIIYGQENEKAMDYLASVERESSHPLAKAILEDLKNPHFYEVEETDVIQGSGILARIEGREVLVGNQSLMEEKGARISQQLKDDLARLEKGGHSIVLTAIDKEIKILMGIRDQLRPQVKENLERFKKLGVKNLILLSGDNQGTVDIIADELNLTEAHGNLLPEDKANYLEERQESGEIVAFIGDGINDSPSVAKADIGIAMGSGTDVAIETSDVVLMNSDFNHLAHSLGLAKVTARNMIQNIVIAVGVVLILLFSLFFSDWMNMSIGMLVHEGSILVVILNGMRLLSYQLKSL